MKIIHQQYIVKKGKLAESEEIKEIQREIAAAVKAIVWPENRDGFYLNPGSKGKGRGEGNGVKPIKDACITYLKGKGWKEEYRVKERKIAGTGPLDAAKETPYGLFAIEWETGNISSSHRALNKICLGVLNGELAGGVLVLPSKELYPFLTDRIGNYREITPYLPLWESIPYKEGLIFILVVEQDGFDVNASRIPKGTDGRALL
ncbi:MAG: Restriction endonuclease BamHI [uncultured bacterium]|nr:MAG: Restriction endonuclease BamHI [uncultured bacterium]OGH14224.1 MAG: hypothetical protein A2687_05875 [Candidatus Levybacteria bacterium RIFCSPHIGHO2_01_FULL_38_26]